MLHQKQKEEQQEQKQKQPNVHGACLNVDSDPYSIFVFAMNSPVTKQKYTYRLVKFFDFIGLEGETIQERCNNAVEMERRNGMTGNGSDGKWLLKALIIYEGEH